MRLKLFLKFETIGGLITFLGSFSSVIITLESDSKQYYMCNLFELNFSSTKLLTLNQENQILLGDLE